MTDTFTQNLADFLYFSSNLLALPFERNFTPHAAVGFTANNWVLVVAIVICYVTFISVGSAIMNNFKAFDLRHSLAVWNAALCIFSFLGMCRTVPYLAASIMTKDFDETICTTPTETWGVGPTGFWTMLFIFSKIPELLDTAFLVLRKKPVIFLHWYHHVTVLLFCWSAYSTMAGSGLYFVAMNYTVHAIMYGYYCLQALNMCPKWFPVHWITISQIAQMFVGTAVCLSAWYYSLSGKSCANDLSNLTAGAIMYGSYLYLFTEFAIRRFIFPAKRSNKAVKKLD